MIGQKFGLLEVIAKADPVLVGKKRQHQRARFICRCACGFEMCVYANNLKSGNSKSCGCTRSSSKRTHGRNASDPTYSTWSAMRSRCLNKASVHYSNYGDRGIKICQRWNRFENFLEDMGERPIGKTLDRINNDGNYEPGNCRWATPREQRANQRRKLTTAIAHQGKTKTMAEWARESVVTYRTFAKRLSAGWAVERALNEPSHATKRSFE
jgi:hypothetical protein